MPINPDAQQHKMICVRIEQNNRMDLEFEFLCSECGFSVALPLFEVLARGDISVSHIDGPDGSENLQITYGRGRDDAELPQNIKDFLDGLDAMI